jgi:predicted aspartyl protease
VENNKPIAWTETFGKIGWTALVAGALWCQPAAAASVVRLDARDNGRLVVSVGLNGKGTYSFLLDTGATTTVLSQKLAEKLGVASRGTARVHTFAGAVLVPVARVDTVGIGSRWIVGVDVVCADLGRMFKLEPTIEGILGQDVLSRFNYLLDRRSRKIELEENGDLGAELSGTPVPFEPRGGKIYVTATGKPIRLMLDSGIPYPVLYEDAGSKVELTMVSRGEDMAARSGIGTRKLRPARLAALDIGDARIRNLQIYVTERIAPQRPEDGILPLLLFDAIYVNNAKAFLILNPHRPVTK